MNQGAALAEGALDAIERRTTVLEHGFVGADIASNDRIETNTTIGTRPVEESAAAATDTSAAATIDTE